MNSPWFPYQLYDILAGVDGVFHLIDHAILSLEIGLASRYVCTTQELCYSQDALLQQYAVGLQNVLPGDVSTERVVVAPPFGRISSTITTPLASVFCFGLELSSKSR